MHVLADHGQGGDEGSINTGVHQQVVLVGIGCSLGLPVFANNKQTDTEQKANQHIADIQRCSRGYRNDAGVDFILFGGKRLLQLTTATTHSHAGKAAGALLHSGDGGVLLVAVLDGEGLVSALLCDCVRVCLKLRTLCLSVAGGQA